MLHTGRRTRGLSWHSRKVNGAFGWRVVCLVLLAFTVVSALPGVTRAASDAYVSTDALYLRSDPITSGSVINEMTYGSYVAVIDGPTDDGWYFVDFDGTQGWAFGDYLSFGAPPVASQTASVGGEGDTVWVDTDALNVRADADRDAAILGTEGQGTEFSIVGSPSAGFYPVAYGDGTGWVDGE